ncbi:MAG TPA: zinc-ribbon domain-containing protein [Thermoplasmata archaeon]|nr:zinc-ribbon domain-containing protein [Thermoplasmata archaeon]
MNCSACGKELPAGATACPACGQPVGGSLGTKTSQALHEAKDETVSLFGKGGHLVGKAARSVVDGTKEVAEATAEGVKKGWKKK